MHLISLQKNPVFLPDFFGFLPETSLPLRGPPYYVASEISLRQSPARSREFRPSESAAVLPQMIRQYGKMWKYGKRRQSDSTQISFQNIEIVTAFNLQLL